MPVLEAVKSKKLGDGKSYSHYLYIHRLSSPLGMIPCAWLGIGILMSAWNNDAGFHIKP